MFDRTRNYDVILNENDGNKVRKYETSTDQNRKYKHELDLGPKAIDLNCLGTEHVVGDLLHGKIT